MLRKICNILLLVVSLNAQCDQGQVYDADRNLCFSFYKTSADFESAESTCLASNGHLVSIHNTIDMNFLAKQAQRNIYTDGPVWLGAKATSEEVSDAKNWKWTDGTPFDYTNYRAGQPSMLDSPACMQFLVGSSKWLTAKCSNHFPFICVAPPAVTTTTCAPTKLPRCPSRYAWLKETNSCYRNVVGFKNFTSANADCEQGGAHLASIHSTLENQFLVDISKTGLNFTVSDPLNFNYAFIGLINKTSTWQWTDGSTVDYFNWAAGEPNHPNYEFWTTLLSDPISASYNPRGGQWNNVENVNHRGHICKRAANF